MADIPPTDLPVAPSIPTTGLPITTDPVIGKYDPNTNLDQSRYNFDYTVFPSDIGMDYNGHYCVININVPTELMTGSYTQAGAAAGNYTEYFSVLGAGELSKLDRLRYGKYNIPGAPENTPKSSFFNSFLRRQTRRIAESIALFMPTPIIYNTHNQYQEISLTALGMKLGASAAEFAGAAVGTLFGGGVAGTVVGATLAGSVFTGTGEMISTGMKLVQSPINPAVEILFANTLQRQFTMEWLLAPRNEAESIAIKKIIQTLRFHAAPELGMAGVLWIPPADFDITFYNKGIENTNILRMNTCVLERCEVDYSPQSGIYSTFRNGHPVAVRLSLAFRELEPVHKLRVLQGF